MLLCTDKFQGKFAFCHDKGCFSAQINFRRKFVFFFVRIKDAFVHDFRMIKDAFVHK